MKFWDDEKSITLTRCVVVAALIGSIAMTLGGPWVTAWFIAVAGLRPSTGLTAVLCLAAVFICYRPFAVLAAAAGFMALLVRVLKNAFAQAVRMKNELDYTI